VNPIPVSLGDFEEVELLVDTGIVHQDVDATKRFDGGLLSRGLVDLGDNDMCTLPGVTQGDSFPNADPATCGYCWASSAAARACTGHAYFVDAGWSRAAPRVASGHT